MVFSHHFIRPAFTCCLLMVLLSTPIARATTYKLQVGTSEIVIKVYKGGAFKALGHNHIISTHDITGTINWNRKNLQDTSFELVIPVNDFRVDDPKLRKQAGKDFFKEVGDNARKGTRKNMMGRKVLDAENFPQIIVTSKSIKQNKASQLNVTVELTIHGISRAVTVPVVIKQNAEVISVNGKFSLLQSDYGIKPLSAAFGSIVVKDRIDIRFRLVARKGQDDQLLNN